MKFLIPYHSTVSARDQMAGATLEQMKAGMEKTLSGHPRFAHPEPRSTCSSSMPTGM